MVRRPRPRPKDALASPGAIDTEVAGRLASGDAKGAATLVIRHLGPELLHYLRRLLDSESEAAEAFAMSSERLWRAIPEWRGEASLRTWTHRVAWSSAADVRKDAFRRRGRRLRTSEALALPARGQTSAHRDEERRRRLDALQRDLPLRDQALLRLRLEQGLSWEDCAQVLARPGGGPSPDALMKRFSRLKARLRRLVSQKAGD